MLNKNFKKVILCLLLLCIFALILGLHGGSEYYFRDFCVHKTLNMFYNNGSPEFFKKPNFVSDIQAIVYWVFYVLLKNSNVISDFDEFTRLFTSNYIQTPIGNVSFMLPGLIVNNIFMLMGLIFTFLTSYILTENKIFPAFVSSFILITTYTWMNLSHHLAVDIPLTSLCIAVIFFTLYFIKDKKAYSKKNLLFLGILSGLCAATKYNGLIISVAPLFVLFFSDDLKRNKFFGFLTFIIGTIVSFYITNPYIFFNFVVFCSDFFSEYTHAFLYGHDSSDTSQPILFHIFHSFPNLIGTIPFILSIIGCILFIKDKQISKKTKYAFLIFPLVFLLLMFKSVLIFLRYLLPLLPIMSIFIGYLVYYLLYRLNINRVTKIFVYVLLLVLFIQGFGNAANFYKIMSTYDTRFAAKEIFKSFHYEGKVSYTDIFSNPYYADDFTGKFPHLKDNILLNLYNANYSSIYIVPSPGKDAFQKYSVIFLDSTTFDRTIQTRKDFKYKNIDNQYFVYYPLSHRKFYFLGTRNKFYITQINPYKKYKSEVPFGNLISDWKYRINRGPFIEIYFKDKDLRDKFTQKCAEYNLKCENLNMNNGYYFENYYLKPY